MPFCPECGEEISESADFCPECGADVSERTVSRTSKSASGESYNYGAGVKTGGLAGLVYGIVETILIAMWVTFAAPMLGALLGGIALVFGGVVFIISGIIGGAIFGIIYARFYNTLPGKTSLQKGLVLAIGFWIIFGVLLQSTSGTAKMGASQYGISLISSLVWGAIVGRFWDSWS